MFPTQEVLKIQARMCRNEARLAALEKIRVHRIEVLRTRREAGIYFGRELSRLPKYIVK
jgi:hypothetical protein